MKFDTYRFTKKPVILGILLVLMAGLLAACGDAATATSGPASGATVGGATTAAGGNFSSSGTTVAGASGGGTPFASGIPAMTGTTIKTASGLQYIDTKVGDGAVAKAGQTVTVHYTGYLAADGKKFDSSVDKGTPFPFQLGTGSVIKGWDEGVAGMKVGGKRRLIIPSSLGYGDGGYPPVIPAKATLVFDVELLSVK